MLMSEIVSRLSNGTGFKKILISEIAQPSASTWVKRPRRVFVKITYAISASNSNYAI